MLHAAVTRRSSNTHPALFLLMTPRCTRVLPIFNHSPKQSSKYNQQRTIAAIAARLWWNVPRQCAWNATVSSTRAVSGRRWWTQKPLKSVWLREQVLAPTLAAHGRTARLFRARTAKQGVSEYLLSHLTEEASETKASKDTAAGASGDPAQVGTPHQSPGQAPSKAPCAPKRARTPPAGEPPWSGTTARRLCCSPRTGPSRGPQPGGAGRTRAPRAAARGPARGCAARPRPSLHAGAEGGSGRASVVSGEAAVTAATTQRRRSEFTHFPHRRR